MRKNARLRDIYYNGKKIGSCTYRESIELKERFWYNGYLLIRNYQKRYLQLFKKNE